METKVRVERETAPCVVIQLAVRFLCPLWHHKGLISNTQTLSEKWSTDFSAYLKKKRRMETQIVVGKCFLNFDQYGAFQSQFRFWRVNLDPVWGDFHSNDTWMKIAALESLQTVSCAHPHVFSCPQASFPAPLWRRSPSLAPGPETDSTCASMTSARHKQETCRSREVRTHWQQRRVSPNYDSLLFMACSHKKWPLISMHTHTHTQVWVFCPHVNTRVPPTNTNHFRFPRIA